MDRASKDALKAVVEGDGIYSTLSELVRIMELKSKTEADPKRRAAARAIAKSIERARDSC